MRRRILATIVAVTTLAVAAFFVPAALAVRSRTQRGDLLALQREASIVASRVPATGPIEVEEVVEVIDPSHEVSFFDSQGRLVAGPAGTEADEFVRAALEGAFAEGYLDGDLVAAVPVRPTTSGPSLVVRILEPREQSSRRIARDIILLAIVGAGVIGLSAILGLLLARRLSRPVEDLGRWAVDLGDSDALPAPAPTGIAELDDLGAAMASADRRIRDLLGAERAFSSHVSHQLRTPVAAMRIAVEAELADPRGDHTEVLQESLGALDRLESTITSLLALARHDPRERVVCDVTGLVADRVSSWRGPLARAGRDVVLEGRPLVSRVDPASLHQVLDVLLDNALVHGRGTVTIETTAASDGFHIDVADEGDPPHDVDPFADRRADGGHGIGLRLARILAEAERGTLELVNSPETRFRLGLPQRP